MRRILTINFLEYSKRRILGGIFEFLLNSVRDFQGSPLEPVLRISKEEGSVATELLEIGKLALHHPKLNSPIRTERIYSPNTPNTV